MRKPIIVGNWKMNKTMKETKEFMEAVDAAAASENAVFGIGAPYTALSAAVAGAKNLVIAAENCHWEDSGAFTGEISVPMLQEVGVTHCIIGHSERREMFNDTDETVNKKAKRLIDAGITPILCIGETEAQYDAGDSEKVIRDQLTGSLADMCPKCVGNMVIAYEPIWAIGTGRALLWKSQKTAAVSFVTRYVLCMVTRLLKMFVYSMVDLLSLTTSLNTWRSRISMVH